jgi:glycosyltransferase involved in cell wall biosynthesis
MGMTCTVCVATYGDPSWVELAQRAIASAEPQAPVVHVHGDTLAGARNAALDLVETEWVVFLDADDELEPGYIDTLAAGTADLRAPAVRYVRGRREREPYVPCVAGAPPRLRGGVPDGRQLPRRRHVRPRAAAARRRRLGRRSAVRGLGAVAALPSRRRDDRDDPRRRLPGARPARQRNRAPSQAERDHWHRTIHAACLPA